MSLFEIKEVDKRYYEQRLRNFLPQRVFDVHTHVYKPQPPVEGEVRTVTWPALVADRNPIEDLVETGIFPLPITLDEEGAMLNQPFLTESPNVLADLLPSDATYAQYIRVIDVPAVTGGRCLEILMDGEHERAVGYLKHTG